MASLSKRNPNLEYDELLRNAANARIPYDRDILLNIAFYHGNHYVQWNGEANSIGIVPRAKGEQRVPRPVANKITQFVVRQHASALKDRPEPDVMPASEDPIDISMASVAGAYLKWLSQPEVADLDNVLSDAVLWALAGGEGYLKWTYDADLKRPDITSCSPLEVYIDPYAKQWNSVRYVIHQQYLDVKEIKNTYGVDVQPTTMSKVDLEKSALLRDMGMAPLLEGALVNEIWVKPGVDSRWPEGLFCVWSGNDVLVEARSFPYAHGLLPFTHIGPIRIPGSPHSTCTTKFMRSPQMELNKYHSQRIMVRQAFSNPKWWLPLELELEADPDDSANQILRGNSNGGQFRPEILQPSVFPDNYDGEWITKEMEDVAGQHQTSNGEVPGRVEAAQAIELLQSADDSHLSELRRSIKTAIGVGSWQSLMLVKQYHAEEVVVQSYSREGLPEVQRFMAEKLSPGMRIRINLGTGLADSRAARTQQATELWQQGVIRDPEVMAELMDLPTSSLNPSRMYDVKLARSENLTIAQGEGIPGEEGVAVKPNSWDNHELHLREHNNYRKSSDYAQLSSEIKQKLEFHCQMHEELWLAELHKQAVRMEVAQGAEPAAAPSGPPQEPATGPAPQKEQPSYRGQPHENPINGEEIPAPVERLGPRIKE